MQTHKSKNMWSEKSPKIKVFYHKSTVPVLLHNHDFYELIYIVDGMGVHTVDSVKYPLCPGSMAYIDAYVPHSISYADTLEYYDIVIGQPILQALGFDSFSQALTALKAQWTLELARNTAMMLLLCLLVVWGIVSNLYGAIHTMRLCRRLKKGHPLDHAPSGRHLPYRLFAALCWLGMLCMLLLMLWQWKQTQHTALPLPAAAGARV